MSKIVFVLVDGLNNAAAQHMGYLAAQVEAGAVHGSMLCELPPLSRPIYATIFTGLTPLAAGISHNVHWQLSPLALQHSFFAAMRAEGRHCAAAAYHWMYELFNGQPYDAPQHRLCLNVDMPLENGLFYDNDAYPDDHVLLDAEALRLRCAPDFLLVHTMGVDYAGHGHGSGSAAYRHAARHTDMLLAHYAPRWLESGHTVIVTSDHGMHADAAHNDTDETVRKVPYWIFGPEATRHTAPCRQTDWRAYLLALAAV